MLFNTILIILGLIMLCFGGSFLVTGSTRVAKRFGISQFVIGATVIGFGTSAPELAVSVLASINGHGEIALGNVIGSNIANIGLVLGFTALLAPLIIEKENLKEEAPPLIISSLLIVGFAWDNNITRIEGSIMLTLLLVYLWKNFGKNATTEKEIEEESHFLKSGGPAVQFYLLLAGLAMLILGANWVVNGATAIARGAGISEWFIGVSVIAVGTCLPELVFSIIAAKRGHGEMAIGNVFGSNIFNILMVMGVTPLINPLAIKESIHPDLIYFTILTFLLLLMIKQSNSIKKVGGVVLISFYIFYILLKGSEIL